MTDRNAQVSAFGYDPLNRVTTSSYADGSGTSYTYDLGELKGPLSTGGSPLG
jgi:uncharacterized protein RhaS with RHS repeats